MIPQEEITKLRVVQTIQEVEIKKLKERVGLIEARIHYLEYP